MLAPASSTLGALTTREQELVKQGCKHVSRMRALMTRIGSTTSEEVRDSDEDVGGLVDVLVKLDETIRELSSSGRSLQFLDKALVELTEYIAKVGSSEEDSEKGNGEREVMNSSSYPEGSRVGASVSPRNDRKRVGGVPKKRGVKRAREEALKELARERSERELLAKARSLIAKFATPQTEGSRDGGSSSEQQSAANPVAHRENLKFHVPQMELSSLAPPPSERSSSLSQRQDTPWMIGRNTSSLLFEERGDFGGEEQPRYPFGVRGE